MFSCLFFSLHSEWNHRQRHVPVPQRSWSSISTQPVIAQHTLLGSWTPRALKPCNPTAPTLTPDPGPGPGAGRCMWWDKRFRKRSRGLWFKDRMRWEILSKPDGPAERPRPDNETLSSGSSDFIKNYFSHLEIWTQNSQLTTSHRLNRIVSRITRVNEWMNED